MSASRVIRIDEQVWAELQHRARPLEDTPNSVLRRVFDLPEESAEPERVDPRVTSLLELVRDLVGQTPQVEAARKGYSLLSHSGVAVAYIRALKQRLRTEASKLVAETVGLKAWDRQRFEGFFGGPSVRWHTPDGDDDAYQALASVLAKLWRSDS